MVEIYVNVNTRPLAFKETSCDRLESLMIAHHFCPALASLLSCKCWFPQLQKALAFQQQDEKLRHAHWSWLWTRRQIAHKTNTDGSSCGACVPIYHGGGDGQESVWGTGLGVSSEIQLLLNIFEPCGQRYVVQLFWSAPPWFWVLRENSFFPMIRERTWSSFDVIVFNRCPCSPWVRLRRRAF